jgi:mannose-6-phosphate isomerase-like protein (cupin superfamily)
MQREKILGQRSTFLRKNNSRELIIKINPSDYKNIFLINGKIFLTTDISKSDLIIKPNGYYMIINNKKKALNIQFSEDVSAHKIIYNPYKYESSEKVNFKEDEFTKKYKIPEGYINTLPKWYSFKFSYPSFNIIFVRPEFGLSIQIHRDRKEFWEILEGKPIIISGNKVYYYVQNETLFQIPINTFHSVINPNKQKDNFVVIKERWEGKFDEFDIERVFNPNNYK